MAPVFITTTALLAATCAGVVSQAAACPTQKAPIAQPSNAQVIRFAIAGLMDIDNDGKSDIDLIRQIIKQGGGTIDAEIDADGELTGQLRPDIRYLVVGKLPGKTTAPPMVAQQFDAFMHRATELNVRVIHLDKLLETGTRTNASDVRNNSIFRERRPPLRRAGSAY